MSEAIIEEPWLPLPMLDPGHLPFSPKGTGPSELKSFLRVSLPSPPEAPRLNISSSSWDKSPGSSSFLGPGGGPF